MHRRGAMISALLTATLLSSSGVEALADHSEPDPSTQNLRAFGIATTVTGLAMLSGGAIATYVGLATQLAAGLLLPTAICWLVLGGIHAIVGLGLIGGASRHEAIDAELRARPAEPIDRLTFGPFPMKTLARF